jgi:hypothetical protein
LRDYSQPCHVSGDRLQWLNPKAFTWNGYKLGSFGNSSPGACAGPPVDNVDFSIVKNWKMTERYKLQLRLEMFNVFNHPQFRFNGQNLGFNVSGLIPVNASGADCRPSNDPTTCVAVSGGTLNGYNPATGKNTLFGRPPLPSQIGNREIQYALKLNF